MNPVKKKLTDILFKAALSEVEELKDNPVFIKESKVPDIEKALREDVKRLVDEVSFAEGAKLLSLIVRFESAHGEKADKIGEKLANMAEDIIARVENGAGKLNFSGSCRKMYLKVGRKNEEFR